MVIGGLECSGNVEPHGPHLQPQQDLRTFYYYRYLKPTNQAKLDPRTVLMMP